MGTKKSQARIVFCLFFLFCLGCKCLASEFEATQTATIKVDASPQLARKIPDTLFGIFFEEINHAGAGGIWAELVNNRGFEAGGPHTPSNIDPWSIIGDDSSIFVATDRTSCFSRNIVALRMEVLCNDCPAGGVGIYNPGFWGMNIEDGKTYNLVMYVKSPETTDLTVSLTSSDGLQNMASATITVSGTSNWTKLEQKLVAKGTNGTSRLQITTNKQGVVWFDQVSLMPEDTYKKMFPLHASVKEIMELSEADHVEVRPMTVINGFVYLSVAYLETQPPEPPGWFLSFCLETAEVNLLLTGISHLCCTIHPYILTSWPSSLIQNKHDSETGVIADISEDDGPTGTAMEETSPVLLTALHSFKETLIDDANVDFAEIDAFLLDDEKNSLVNRIIALESRLTTARESVLRIGAESDNKKGMERGSWWQMWKERLGRALSQFFTG